MTFLASDLINVFWHHGDCIGADEDFHDIVSVWSKNPHIINHPPILEKYTAYKAGHKIMQPKPYLMRNHDIVDESNLLIAAPKHLIEEIRSGTWATIRYAKKKHIPTIILNP